VLIGESLIHCTPVLLLYCNTRRIHYDADKIADIVACEQIMAVKRVPHWDHVELIAALRTILKPDKAWNDVRFPSTWPVILVDRS
jgi:hypothetical protein